MSTSSQIKLNTDSILNVPLQLYENFSFIVNGEEFKTTQLVSELLSPKICRIRACDPTINQINIKTKHKGDFSNILKLCNFESNSIKESELPFISEIIEILENESIEIEGKFSEITENNAIEYVKKYQVCKYFYTKPLTEVIDYISSNFSTFLENQKEELEKLDVTDLEQIINNPKLVLKNEDQLMTFINELYLNDSEFSQLYKCVLFQFVSLANINLFLNIFNYNDMTCDTWKALSCRLKQDVKKGMKKNCQKAFQSRYKDKLEFNDVLFF